MRTPTKASAAKARTSPADRAVRTGPGRVTSANRAKIKLEDADRDSADRTNASGAEAGLDGDASAQT